MEPCSTPGLQSAFYTMPQYPCCFSKNGRMNFDCCLTQDDLSYMIKSWTLKTLINIRNRALLHKCMPKDQSRAFLSVAWPTGVQLSVFFCSSVSVGFSTPQGSPGVGSNMFLSSPHLCFIIVFIYDLFFFPWWSIDELENLHADWTIVCFEPWQKPRARLGTRKTGLSPAVIFYWPFQGGTSVVVHIYLLSYL